MAIFLNLVLSLSLHDNFFNTFKLQGQLNAENINKYKSEVERIFDHLMTNKDDTLINLCIEILEKHKTDPANSYKYLKDWDTKDIVSRINEFIEYLDSDIFVSSDVFYKSRNVLLLPPQIEGEVDDKIVNWFKKKYKNKENTSDIDIVRYVFWSFYLILEAHIEI
ncbi:hypothetical protein P3W45_001819 [Vairimorpha bombi]|jgi:succinate dehydrogenase flavin-adding protein (antitoxin of CptAB toxin-antitoxin module)